MGITQCVCEGNGKGGVAIRKGCLDEVLLEWQTQQVKVEEIHAAVGKLRQAGITIGSPRSLTKTILDMRAARKTGAVRTIISTDFTESESEDVI